MKFSYTDYLTPSNPTLGQLVYSLYRVPRGGRGVKPRAVRLKLICSGGDQGEPVMTIMLPDQD